MVEYTCHKCNKIFDRKSNYETHINRKKPCIAQKEVDKIQELEKNMETKLQSQQKEIEKLKEEIKQLLQKKDEGSL